MRKIILQDVEAEKEEIRRLRRNIGSEFLGEFTKALKKKDITHYFNYPRYPKGQAYVERMNRILQDEFIMYYEDYELEDICKFNKKIL
jgi:transposase InsO family protein